MMNITINLKDLEGKFLSEDFINLIDGMEGIFIEAPIITSVLDEDEEEILVYKYNIYKLDNNDNVLDETWIYSID